MYIDMYTNVVSNNKRRIDNSVSIHKWQLTESCNIYIYFVKVMMYNITTLVRIFYSILIITLVILIIIK